MRKLSRREKLLLGLLAVLLTVVSYARLFYQPVVGQLVEARERVTAAEDALVTEQGRLAQLRSMEQSLEEMRQSRDFRDSLLPDYDNIKLVMVELDAILLHARDYELIFAPPDFGPRLAERSVELTFSAGSYAAAKEILTALYDFPYRCELHDVTILPQDNAAQVNIAAQPVFVKLTMTLYEKLSPALYQSAGNGAEGAGAAPVDEAQ